MQTYIQSDEHFKNSTARNAIVHSARIFEHTRTSLSAFDSLCEFLTDTLHKV